MTQKEMIEQFDRAVSRLKESLEYEKDDRTRDSAILRFVLCSELAWKTLKFHLENVLKVRCASPKACFREAHNQGLIEYENRWLDMVDDRNNVAHLYKEDMAEDLFSRLPEYAKLLDELLVKLRAEQE